MKTISILGQWSSTRSHRGVENIIALVIGVRQHRKIPRQFSFHLTQNKANNIRSRPAPPVGAERRGFIKIDLTSSASNKMRRARATSSSSQSDSDFANKSSRTQTKRGARAISNNKKSVFYGTISIAPLCARESRLQSTAAAADQWMHTPVKVVSEHAIPLFCQPHSIYIYLLFCSRPHSFDANSFLLRELRERTISMLMLFKFCCCVLGCWKIIKASVRCANLDYSKLH
jgi:hypothetical protein